MEMYGEFTIVDDSAYLDGGTKVFRFSDGWSIYQDFRLYTETEGKFFIGYPSGGKLIELSGDRKRLIENHVSKYSKL